jgi:hypothetical protein
MSFDEALAAATVLEGSMLGAAEATTLPTDVDRADVDETLGAMLKG